MEWLQTIAGFAVGVIIGLTGVGGAALMTPALVLLFGVAPSTAIGTDLWFAAITKLAGGIVHGRSGTVDWQVFRRLCYGSLPASIVTLLLLHSLNRSKIGSGALLPALGGALIITAVAMLFQKRLHAVGTDLRTRLPADFKRWQPGLTALAGAILGLLVSLTSVGAGALGAVMLLYLYPFRMKPARLVGTDIVHAIPLTLVAGSGHLLMGNVEFGLLGSLLLGSIPGILIGSMASTRAPAGALRVMIALVLVIAGAKLIV